MLPICIALKIISTIENISFILYVYYCHLNHLFCQILVVTPTVNVHVHVRPVTNKYKVSIFINFHIIILNYYLSTLHVYMYMYTDM